MNDRDSEVLMNTSIVATASCFCGAITAQMSGDSFMDLL